MFAFLTPTQSNLARKLAWVVELLGQAVAAHIARDRTAGPLIVLIRQMLSRRFARFSALAARFEAGKLRSPRARPPRLPARVSGSDASGDAPARKTRPKSFERSVADHLWLGTWRLGWVTRRPAWLLRIMPGMGEHGERLRLIVEEPAMVELLRASPQARRLLRPLFWMLSPDPLPEVLRREVRRRPDGSFSEAGAPACDAPGCAARDEAPAVARKPRRGRWPGVLAPPRRADPYRSRRFVTDTV